LTADERDRLVALAREFQSPLRGAIHRTTCCSSCTSATSGRFNPLSSGRSIELRVTPLCGIKLGDVVSIPSPRGDPSNFLNMIDPPQPLFRFNPLSSGRSIEPGGGAMNQSDAEFVFQSPLLGAIHRTT